MFIDEDLDGICDEEDDCVGQYDCEGNCNGSAIILFMKVLAMILMVI